MFPIDQWVEKHIKDASDNGEFDNLAGRGKPLVLDDDSAVPEELRTAYRILKNAGYLPPELQDKKEAIELDHMLKSVIPDNPSIVSLTEGFNFSSCDYSRRALVWIFLMVATNMS